MKIVVLCTLSTGLSAIQHAISQGLKITKIIGLFPDEKRDINLISGIIDIAQFCKANAIEYSYVSDYTLKTETPVYFSLKRKAQKLGIRPRYLGSNAVCKFRQPLGARSISGCLNISFPAIEINKSGL